MLSLDHVGKSLGDFVLRDVSFDVAEGEYFVLLGASGVGKTVLLELIAGLRRPDRGAIRLDGRDVTRERIQARGMGLVYQDQALFPHMTVRGNIAYGLRTCTRTRSQRRSRLAEVARTVGVSDLLDRRPASLSGGEAQRVALARALAAGPRCLLLDEPLSSLDVGARGELRAHLRRLARDGQTILHVTHDFEEAVSLAGRIAVMENGTIAQVGSPDDVLRHPESEFVARFVGIRNCIRGTLVQGSPGDLAEFRSTGPVFRVLTDAPSGTGIVLIRSEDITLSNGKAATSARNVFRGIVSDVAPGRLGFEVTLDVGVPLCALVTHESVRAFAIRPGAALWAEFKASATRFIPD